jgi:hypothetical protein
MGSFGLFFTCFLLFCRYLPMLAMAELKPLLKTADLTQRRGDAGKDEEWENGERTKAVAGVMAEFDNAPALLKAAASVRDAGYTKWDAHTPYPVHGLDKAMGIRRTPLPWLVFIAGATGAAVGVGLQWFTNAFDYPLLVSGKPFFSLPACIPVVFELTILFAAIAAVLGMLGLNRLPELYHALFTRSRFRRASDDRYFIWIEASDPKYGGAETLLRAQGAAAVETVED